MEPDEFKLLTEIRDAQREHLVEYRKVAQESLALQRQAVARQEKIGKLYQRVVILAGAVVLLIVLIVIYLLYYLSRFR